MADERPLDRVKMPNKRCQRELPLSQLEVVIATSLAHSLYDLTIVGNGVREYDGCALKSFRRLMAIGAGNAGGRPWPYIVCTDNLRSVADTS